MRTKRVVVVPYDEAWKNAFEEIKTKIEAEIGALIIGIDVLPAYRKQGIASALTSRLAIEILNRGKVPFYCAAWCNIKSVRNAIRSGFRPAWVEITAKSCETVDGMNK